MDPNPLRSKSSFGGRGADHRRYRRLDFAFAVSCILIIDAKLKQRYERTTVLKEKAGSTRRIALVPYGTLYVLSPTKEMVASQPSDRRVTCFPNPWRKSPERFSSWRPNQPERRKSERRTHTSGVRESGAPPATARQAPHKVSKGGRLATHR